MSEPTTEQTDAYFEFSSKGFEITGELADLDTRFAEGQGNPDTYQSELTTLAQSALEYLEESQKQFPQFFAVDMEAEGFARSLTGERKQDFALRFNELLHASIADPSWRIDAIADYSPLQRAIDLTAIGDRINDGNYYVRPNPVRQSGDAVIGRAVQHMLSFNMDPRLLRIPVR